MAVCHELGPETSSLGGCVRTQASPLLTTGSLSREKVFQLLLAFPDKSILNCVFFFQKLRFWV